MTANTVGIWSCSFATVQLTRYIRSSSQFPSTTLITRPLSGLVSCTKIIIMCALCVLPYLLINLHWVTCTTARRAVTHTHTEKESVWLVNNGERSWFCDYLFCFIVEPSSLHSVITVIYVILWPNNTIKSNRIDRWRHAWYNRTSNRTRINYYYILDEFKAIDWPSRRCVERHRVTATSYRDAVFVSSFCLIKLIRRRLWCIWSARTTTEKTWF